MEFRIDKPTIKRIGWEISDYLPDQYNAIEIGENGVTKIDAAYQHLGDYQICWLQVWKSDSLIFRFNAANVDSIEYEEDNE